MPWSFCCSQWSFIMLFMPSRMKSLFFLAKIVSDNKNAPFHQNCLFLFVCFFQGIFISRVTENGPAAKAGLLVGDKLISVSVLLLVPIISRSVSWSVGRSVDLEPHSNLSYISTVSSTSFLQPGQRSWFVSCRTSRSCWGVEACRSRRHRRCRQRSSRRSGNSFISSRRQRQEQQRHHQ